MSIKTRSLTGSEPIPEKVSVIFPGALGDFICFLPALRELVRGREADLFARTEYGELLPATVRTLSLECYEVSRLFVPGAESDEGLKYFFGSYSCIYSWMGSGQKDFVRNLKALCDGRLKVFPFLPTGSRIHMVDYFLSCLGIESPKEVTQDIPIKSDALDWSRRFWLQYGLEKKKVLALAPGSGAREKNWPSEFYKVVVEWWEKRFSGKVLVVLGPVEEERGETGNEWGHTLVARGLELAKTAALLGRCALYLGNDSGITHMVAALGVETVVLFGPTDPIQWTPRGKKVTVVTKNVECSPCDRSAMKVCPRRKCLTMLAPGEVINILERLSERRGDGHDIEVAFLTRGEVGIKVKNEKQMERRPTGFNLF